MKRYLATAWWLLAVQSGLLGAASGALLLLFSCLPAPELAARIAACGPGESPALLTPARYLGLRLGLGAGLGLGLLGLTWALGQRTRPRRPYSYSPARTRRPWWFGFMPGPALTPAQGWLAGGLLGAVAGLHGWLAWYDPLSFDEAVSYDWFMHAGPAVAASYYPFPNNHVLLSVLGAGLHQLVPAAGPLLVLRLLPTLVGLVALLASYQVLLAGLRFGPATLAWLLINVAPPVLTAAVAGRGYGVAFAALLGGVLASLVLLRPQGAGRAARRGAWVVFGVSGVLGLYAVPTHLYGLLGLLGSLLVGFGQFGGRRFRRHLLHLAVVSVGMALVVATLYGPVIAVTSWGALAHNAYVQPLPWPALWRQLTGGYFPGVAGVLLGWPRATGSLFGLVALVSPLMLGWGRLPALSRRLGWLAYVQLVAWLGFMQAQRVLPPARTLLAVPFFLVLLGFMGGQWAVARWLWPGPRRAARWVLVAGLGLVSGVGSYRVGHYWVATATPRRRSLASFERTYAWLRRRHPRVVWVPSQPLAVYLRHEALRRHQPPLPLVAARPPGAVPRPGEYQVMLQLSADQPAVYRDGQVAIVGAGEQPAVSPVR
ncbi:MAG: hypothetical protein EOO59_01820 [Hymenobacter sp.]|nr:MAG: hypothetical protein EOO59_01820 [Hymenobacter sp.]